MKYNFLEQRVAAFYINLLAPFAPGPDVELESQEEFHAFVSGFLQRIYDHPDAFFPLLHEDDAPPNRFNLRAYGKPELIKNMKSAHKKIGELFALLKKIGSQGEVRGDGIALAFAPGKKERKLLEFLGLETAGGIAAHPRYPRMAAAWRFLALKPDAVSLERCWFADDYPYLEETFARFYDPRAYAALVGWLREQGYTAYQAGKDYPGVGSAAILDFAKCTSAEEKPLGYAIHGDKFHYGFTFEYRYEPQVPQHSELRILRYKDMLEGFAALPAGVQNLIRRKAKRCDNCGYCTQLDKTGRRPQASVTLPGGDSLCTYYPGFSFVFTELDLEVVAEITAFLEAMEKITSCSIPKPARPNH